MMKMIVRAAFCCLVVVCAATALSQQPLDPTRNLAVPPPSARIEQPAHYIWTAGDSTIAKPDHRKFPWNRPDLRTEPHFFRSRFNVSTLPGAATLYVAGPREAVVYLNGKLLAEFRSNPDAPIGFHVFHTDAMPALRIGTNVLAIQAVRGRGVVTSAVPLPVQQLAYGEVLATEIVPAVFGAVAQPLVFSAPNWKSSATYAEHWSEPGFDDAVWKAAESLGTIESTSEFYQWSADAGMYGWPGYLGMSSFLRVYSVPVVAVTHVFRGKGDFKNLDTLTGSAATEKFAVKLSEGPSPSTDAESPSLILDFGREVAGRVLIESGSSKDTLLSIAYGESELEAMATGLTSGDRGGNYLGTNLLDVPAHGIARGPKSGFRYVRIGFLCGAPETIFNSIRVEGIYDPVEYKGSFASSDERLNRIWESAAYTAHLCMQDGLWDAPKRDRGRWVGDMDVEGRVISTVFGDAALIEDTLRHLVPSGDNAVNGLSGYSALWITSLYDLYSRSGDKDFVVSQKDGLLRILRNMDSGLNADGLFVNARHQWLFVDWAPGLYGNTDEALLGTNLQYALAYKYASQLFGLMGDQPNADKYLQQGRKTLLAIERHYRDGETSTFGTTWQLNALAVRTLRAFNQEPEAATVLWSRVFSHVKQTSPGDQVISPYFNLTVLEAMGASSHQREALDWLRAYWGGMLDEGATSFWESYDLRWPKTNPHLSLQADGTSGYFVSLAHGWSAGPALWLVENILGIRDPIDGYREVTIAPHLAGLDWARGAVPTPHGVLTVAVDSKKGIQVDLPSGIERAHVIVDIPQTGTRLFLDGAEIPRTREKDEIILSHPGRYQITVQ